MTKATRTIAGAALAAIIAAAPAQAQQVSAAYNSTHSTSVIRAEHATDNSYAFIDAIGNKQFDTEGIYGEARFNVPIRNLGPGTLKAGIDLNGGSNFNDRAALQAVYSTEGKWGFVEARLAKSVTDDSPVRVGYAAATSLKGTGVSTPLLNRLGISTWGSIDLHAEGAQFLGELEVSYDLGKGFQALVREEHYPWSGYATQLGLKKSL